jgi:GTPase SAR1 family protein
MTHDIRVILSILKLSSAVIYLYKMTENVKMKILLIGSCKTGKSLISNYLAEMNYSVNAEYHPTVGVRYANIAIVMQIFL